MKPTRADEFTPANSDQAVVLGFHRGLMSGDMDAFESIWTEDAIQEIPYHSEKAPPAFNGRDEIVADYRHMFANRKDMVFTITSFAEVDDPKRFIVEFSGRSIIGETGAVYENSYVGIFTLQEGRIKNLRLYANPRASMASLSTILGAGQKSS